MFCAFGVFLTEKSLNSINLMIKRLFSALFGSQLRQNMSSGVIRAVINAAVLLVSYPLYLHYLGYEKFGLWSILTTVLSFAQISNIGIAQAVTKLTAEEYGRNNKKAIQAYIVMALTILIISGTTVVVPMLIFKTQIVALFKLSPANGQIVSWLLPYIALLSLYVLFVQVFNATVMGLGRMDLANSIQLIGQVLSVGSAVFLLWMGNGIESLLIGSALSYLFIHIVSLIIIKRITGLHFFEKSYWKRGYLKRLLHFGAGVSGSSLLSLLVEPFTKLMLSRHVGVTAVPIFEISFRAAVQIRALFESGLSAIMPEISRLSGSVSKQAWQRIRQITIRAMKLVVSVSFPFYTFVFIAAEFLLKLWLRQQYRPELTSAFRIMLIASFFSLAGVPAFHTIMGFGKVRYCLIANSISALGNAVILISICYLPVALTVNRAGLGLSVVFGLSSIYLIYKFFELVSQHDNRITNSMSVIYQNE